MESARGNEKDVISLHHPMFGRNGRSLNNGKQIPLNPFPRNIRAGIAFSTGDLVNIVNKDDA